MSVLDGPGEGTWSVFAEKVVAERDEALAEVERLRAIVERQRQELAQYRAGQQTLAGLAGGDSWR